MIYCNLLKLSVILSLSTKYDCVIKTREMFNFLPLINSSDTIGFSFFPPIVSAISPSKTINNLHSFYNNLQYFCRHFAYHLSIQ